MWRYFICGIMVFSSLMLTAEETLEPTGSKTVKLSLRDCIELALRNNLDIAVQRCDRKIRRTEIDQAQGSFDPIWSLSSMKYKSVKLTTVSTPTQTSGVNELEKAKDESLMHSLSLSKKFLTGTIAELFFTMDKSKTDSTDASQELYYQGGAEDLRPRRLLDNYWTTSVGLSLIQPLLRGGGKRYNESDILIARNNQVISDEDFKARLINSIFLVQSAYWNLVNALKQKEVQEKSLRFAESLLETNRARVKAGALSSTQELQAEVGVAIQQEAMLMVQKAIDDAQDNLKRLIMPIQDKINEWNFDIIAIDEPELFTKEFDIEQSFNLALVHRPDYFNLKKQFENQSIIIVQARNKTKPTLNLQGNYSYSGAGEKPNDSFDVLKERDYYDWGIGLVFEFPLGNRSARSQLKKIELTKRQILLQLQNLKQQILIEVREAVRGVQTALKRVEATRKTYALAQKQLETELKLFELGASISHQVLEMQRELTRAESNTKKALIDYNIAVLSYQKAIATLLEENNIRVE